MGSLFLLICISVFVVVKCQNPDQVNFGDGVNQHLLKDLKMLNNTKTFYEELCVECLKGTTYLIQHPENCGVVVYCVPDLGIFLMRCTEGTLFSEIENTCVNPDEVVCRLDADKTNYWSPCKNDKTPFRHPKYCRKYMVCTDPNSEAFSSQASIKVKDCPDNEGFDTVNKRCSPSAECLSFVEEIEEWVRKKVSGPYCGPISGENKKYWYNVTARYRRNENEVVNENFMNDCPAATYYPSDSTGCSCIHSETKTSCAVYTLANFASRTNVASGKDTWISWDDALYGTAAISGNATINADKGAFFERTVYTVHTLMYNEMGKYFTLSFTFLPQRRNPLNPTGEMVNGANPGTYALVDNSACGISSTYGCRLVVDSRDFGKVMCAINASRVEEKVLTYNYHAETSKEALQLNEPIKVTLTRNNDIVKMDVEQRGNVDTVQWPMMKADRIMGTKCGLTLAAGTGQKYFTGFIDNLRVTKFCPPTTE